MMKKALQTTEIKESAAEWGKPYSIRVAFANRNMKKIPAAELRQAFFTPFSVDQITKIIDKNKFSSNYNRRESRYWEVPKRTSWTIPGLAVFSAEIC